MTTRNELIILVGMALKSRGLNEHYMYSAKRLVEQFVVETQYYERVRVAQALGMTPERLERVVEGRSKAWVRTRDNLEV